MISSEHLRGVGCPRCNGSKGELVVERFLVDNNIRFVRQCKYFEDLGKSCINPMTNRKLMFDFYLPDHNKCIEFDGVYHYKPEFLDARGFGYAKYHTDEHYERITALDSLKTNFV